MAPATLSDLLDIYAPRLSRAQSISVPQIFQAFWTPFSSIHADQFDDKVRSFTEQVLAAVPGLIAVPGLVIGEVMSQEESASRYPHALGVERILGSSAEDQKHVEEVSRGNQREGEGEVLIDDSEMEIDPAMLVPDATTAYDADISQLESEQEGPRKDIRDLTSMVEQASDEIPEGSSTRIDEAVLSQSVAEAVQYSVDIENAHGSSAESDVTQAGCDVFGPTAKPASQPKRGKKRGRKAGQSRSKAASPTERASQPMRGEPH